jgi:molybdopterin-guanine dinucleotide biosynthesis protein B
MMGDTFVKRPFIYQVVGYKNSGKTTLICKFIEAFTKLGYRVGTIKHDGHDFEIDIANTDTWKHRAAGAVSVAITSPKKTAYIEMQPTPLDRLVERMEDVDILLVEGFKAAHYPKIVMLKDETELPLVQQVSEVIAVAAWFTPVIADIAASLFHVEDVEALLRLLAADIEVRQGDDANGAT